MQSVKYTYVSIPFLNYQSHSCIVKHFKFTSILSPGILAFAATQQYYMLNQISHQILPAMCILTSDPEREVRDQAFKVIKGFLNKLERVSEDPSLRESMGNLENLFLEKTFLHFCIPNCRSRC